MRGGGAPGGLQTPVMRAKGFSVSMVRHRRVDVDGIGVFYREAGSRNSGKLKSDEGIASRALPNLRIF
jgi:hypothetical protein